MRKVISTPITLLLVLVALQFCAPQAIAQGGFTIFGDVRVVGDHNEVVPKEVILILRRVPDGNGRQMVSAAAGIDSPI